MREDDMDEMLRIAAENYEVDAKRAADWEAVYAAVHKTDEFPEEQKRKRRFAFWWLLLIPLGWIAHTEYNKFGAGNTKAKSTQAISVPTKTNNNTGVTKSSSSETVSTNDKSVEKNINKSDIAAHYHQFSLSHFKPGVNSGGLTDHNSSLILSQQKSEEPQRSIQSYQPTSSPAKELNAGNNNINNSPSIPPLADEKSNSTGLNKNANQSSTPAATASTAKSITIKVKNNTHYFYAGLIAGGDFSFVKFQDMEPIGYNIGLLVGYKFNKISIESGFLFDKKNYYTDGEYFDKSKIPFFDNAKVLSVDGYCNMYEIPLNVKYDAISVKRHVWYATGGLSSYLMNKEYYNYAFIKNGEEHYGSAPYYHTTKDWFSVLNLGAGYQLQTGSKTNLRIEPYFKTTLGGVGTGDLPISSIGLNVGITRRIP
jgi:hypothetical protein